MIKQSREHASDVWSSSDSPRLEAGWSFMLCNLRPGWAVQTVHGRGDWVPRGAGNTEWKTAAGLASEFQTTKFRSS